VSRGEFVAMISDYFNWIHWSEYNDYAKSVPVTVVDVRAGDKYTKQIECALEAKIISPDDTDKFYPNKPITRKDATEILSRAFDLSPATVGGLMKGGAETLTSAQAHETLKEITTRYVTPVQVMPKPGTTSNRRNINITTPTPGARIYYTISSDGTEPADPTTASKEYKTSDGYLQLDNPMTSKVDYRYWTIKAIAIKDGMATTPVQSFSWVIYRPKSSPFQARLVHARTTSAPVVWEILNPSDFNFPHVLYIEGTQRGVVMDAGQYPFDPHDSSSNLKTYIDTLATKPYDAVLGHAHPDHDEQIDSFVQGGVRLYLTAQDKAFFLAQAAKRPDWAHAATASSLIKDGDVLDLGNVKMYAYQVPAHEDGLVMLDDKQDGWVFATDMFGPNRPATADLANFSGVKNDLFLSMIEQLYANLRKDGGKITEVYNAHNEAPFGVAGIDNFEKGFQELIDIGSGALTPSMRGVDPGGHPMPNRRQLVVGDMWRDKNWTGVWIDGTYGGPVNYLSKPTTAYKNDIAIDYNSTDGIKKYSVLGNVEVANGELVGVDLSWAAPKNGVENTLPNKFDPWTYAYEIRVPAANSEITIKPTALSNKIASLKINGASVKNGTGKTIAVSDGSKIVVDVVAPDGVTASKYILTVKKY